MVLTPLTGIFKSSLSIALCQGQAFEAPHSRSDVTTMVTQVLPDFAPPTSRATDHLGERDSTEQALEVWAEATAPWPQGPGDRAPGKKVATGSRAAPPPAGTAPRGGAPSSLQTPEWDKTWGGGSLPPPAPSTVRRFAGCGFAWFRSSDWSFADLRAVCPGPGRSWVTAPPANRQPASPVWPGGWQGLLQAVRPAALKLGGRQA